VGADKFSTRYFALRRERLVKGPTIDPGGFDAGSALPR